MDTKLKQRILGVIVLISLLGICLTILLHNNKDNAQIESQVVKTTPPSDNGASSFKVSDGNLIDDSSSQSVIRPQDNSTDTSSNNKVLPSTSSTNTPTEVETSGTTKSTSKYADVNSSTNAEDSTNVSVSDNLKQDTNLADKTKTAITDDILSAEDAGMVVKKDIVKKTVTSKNRVTDHQSLNTIKTAKVATLIPSKQDEQAKHVKISAVKKYKNDVKVKPISLNKVWQVQAGSFSYNANAETLVENLRKHGFTANVQKIHTANGIMMRVIVGESALDRHSAETLKLRLDKVMHLKVIIVPKEETKSASLASSKKSK